MQLETRLTSVEHRMYLFRTPPTTKISMNSVILNCPLEKWYGC